MCDIHVCSVQPRTQGSLGVWLSINARYVKSSEYMFVCVNAACRTTIYMYMYIRSRVCSLQTEKGEANSHTQ